MFICGGTLVRPESTIKYWITKSVYLNNSLYLLFVINLTINFRVEYLDWVFSWSCLYVLPSVSVRFVAGASACSLPRIDQFFCFRLSRTFPPSPPFPAVTTLASSHDVLIGYTGNNSQSGWVGGMAMTTFLI